MHTESDIFSSPKSQEAGATQALTQRLYSDTAQRELNDPYAGKAASTFEELKKMLTTEPGQEKETGHALEAAIKNFQLEQAERGRQYLESAKARSKLDDNCLYYLNGWNASPQQLFLTEQSRKATGGIFLRWNGKGIAINPGAHFLRHFHAQGFHIQDIDYVIVTSDQPDSYQEVKEIYELNYQINKLSQQLQIIHYYFNQKAFQDLSRILKPHFKQERNTLHSLELFIDSPEVEKVDLDEGITLNYFLAASREAFPTSQDTKEERAAKLSIRLDLKAPAYSTYETGSLRIGYASQAAWSPLLAHHLGNCDLLLAGFGHTSPQDYQKLSYNADSLGYNGTITLLEEMAPRLVLCGEFSGREGDIRLEVVQKMRDELASNKARSARHAPTLLPADIGLCVSLKSLDVRCSVNDTWISPAEVKVVKTSENFGSLAYLAPAFVY